jgi:protein-tyrosine phosphatase
VVQVTASLIIPGLYVGNAPPPHDDWSSTPVKHLVLAAAELAPEQTEDKFPGVQVLYAPLHDDYNKVPPHEAAIAFEAATQVAHWLEAGEGTVVTCHEGHSRSGLIAALALVLSKQASPEEAIHLVRAARGPLALQNPQFLKLLLAAGKPQEATAS